MGFGQDCTRLSEHVCARQEAEAVPRVQPELVKAVKTIYRERGLKYWNDAYENINKEHLALKYGSVCYDCIKRKEETEEGKTFVPCTECGEKCKSKHDLQGRIDKLEEEVRYWQGCYETLLEEQFGDGRRSYDGTLQRL